MNESFVAPREVFRPAIIHSAFAFVMVHNHPSGTTSPSEADLQLTKRVAAAAQILNSIFWITLLSARVSSVSRKQPIRRDVPQPNACGGLLRRMLGSLDLPQWVSMSRFPGRGFERFWVGSGHGIRWLVSLLSGIKLLARAISQRALRTIKALQQVVANGSVMS